MSLPTCETDRSIVVVSWCVRFGSGWTLAEAAPIAEALGASLGMNLHAWDACHGEGVGFNFHRTLAPREVDRVKALVWSPASVASLLAWAACDGGCEDTDACTCGALRTP